jgi:GAF domain-containing protein
MSYAAEKINYENKNEFYKKLNEELVHNLDKHWFTNLAQFSALVFDQLPDINWVGFYLNVSEELILGPFQGKPACMKIHFGRGVCGTSAQKREAILVDDVEAFPGHIACDSASRSEVVIPLIQGGKVLGVLDVDSPSLKRFTQEDVVGLSLMAETLLKTTQIAL